MYSSSQPLGLLAGAPQDRPVGVRELGAGGRAAHLGAPLDRRHRRGAQRRQVGARPLEHRLNDALARVQQREQQVLGLDHLVAAVAREARRLGDRLLGPLGRPVDRHQTRPPFVVVVTRGTAGA